ncbi:four-carbon acid sugar kinase family protein [Janthinobacterium agaricidamnosum]|uniref:Four-carbon acid sugar kinase family protein n=1 Tax=Janthinobacterium agaricidamnosum NBRC 102515 = DSM 9628 TaxID=1349767 RepID=W0V4J7_9BURK|nr:four-carbon acid sugar kinase family protein [Janthinobacterium agaricidamnosum]CDG82500.1 hypothetical protein GJA_1864 [Janthinobacterium agaricidamnosum NBRC 102515 = DSM 9628]
MQLRIITDDFTSALDGTACFAQCGWDTAVLIAAEGMNDAAIASIDTRTRESSGAHAASTVSAAATAWSNADVLIKQFDSTLRGFIPQECLAAQMASGRRKLLIAPAFPSAGRSTESGSVYVDGVPVHLTAFAQDPTHPVTVSNLPELFRAHGVAVKVARDAADARALLGTHAAVVVDARSEEDLDELVRNFISAPDLLWAGSTGLLRSMARVLPPPQSALHAVDAIRAAAEIRARRPWLLVGSLNPRSRRQLGVARARHGVNALATGATYSAQQGALHDIVLQIVHLLGTGACDGLVVTGGETARRIVDALPATSLRVCREVEPGTPLVLVQPATSAFPMVTKAGGFGDDQALLRCLDALTGVEQ